jgi:gliding motility-associated-like protein
MYSIERNIHSLSDSSTGAFLRYLLLILFLLLLAGSLQATHNRAGEISYEQIGPLMIRVTLTTYTKTSSIAADRDSVEIFWGDGTSEFAVRANGWGDPQPNDVKINYYIASHSYPARATYTISMYDPNRVGGILNVNYPDSESVPFYLETTVTFLNTQFQGENNSAVLLQAPIDFGCVGEVFIHNPNAYDVDGDSLRYGLLVPLQGKNSVVPDYVYPDQIDPGPDNRLTLDETTGDLVWDAPQIPGEYNVALFIEEYRQGVLISRMIRDMQIFILDQCQNQPPTLTVMDETCILAGDTLRVNIQVDDPNPGQLVRLEASGAPFISTKNTAVLQDGFEFKEPSFNALFEWVTSCEDVSDQYYQIVFKAADNGISDTSGLATLKSFRVKVMAPPVNDLTASLKDNHHRLSWSYPYACAFADDDYFLGFSIWRSNSSLLTGLDSCETGLEDRGYKKIVFLHDLNDGVQYIYDDVDVEVGQNYCYRVVPEFARKSFDGFPYNQVSGKPSNESCIALPLSFPYIRQVSVLKTGTVDGQIRLKWSFPDPELFDSLLYPGPYTLVLKRSADGISFEQVPGAVFEFESPSLLQDTVYTDQGLNTEAIQYTYILEFYRSGNAVLIEDSHPASSVFISGIPGDNRIFLDFAVDVPWTNYRYDIYRKDSQQGTYLLLDSSQIISYRDFSVKNGESYCYRVESRGSYLFDQLTGIFNLSQEICLEPSDLTPPCTPVLTVENPCDTLSVDNPTEDLRNVLRWSFPDPACIDLDDLAGFNVYFSVDTSLNGLEQIRFIDDPEQFLLEHEGPFGLQGCYAVSAVDSTQNESPLSNMVCVENCPLYVLPNVFTPNNDGTNDEFVPRINRHVFEVDMKVFNQWGQKVFETDDPMINWDGTNFSGQPLAEGTYHYVCIVYGLPGPGPTVQLSGFIQLIRGR